ncbi:hypothetical protein WICPIJ_007263 [Wickerhamomyces pijperi]|uniref:Protein kinase domain-containing protein n=1 Tax=Wickerhamomyces pijperi TaxID=599730 RepID=A0A9P8TK45_WICPI|nr:hypothetical protein WICPIJ_007263 [Wickerhamomyces pijperi]
MTILKLTSGSHSDQYNPSVIKVLESANENELNKPSPEHKSSKVDQLAESKVNEPKIDKLLEQKVDNIDATSCITTKPNDTKDYLLILSLKQNYKIILNLSGGAFGQVYIAQIISKDSQPRSKELQVETKGTLLERTKGYENRNYQALARKVCAIKIMRPKREFNTIEKTLKSSEVQFVLNVPYHDNLLQSYGMFFNSEASTPQFCLTMEPMETDFYETINVRAREKKPFKLSTVKNILKQIIDGLAHMHKHGWYHRDVKTENILCTRTGSFYSEEFIKEHNPYLKYQEYVVKIADYGSTTKILKPMEKPSKSFGTVAFLPPEIALEVEDVSYEKMDIWGVGCIALDLMLMHFYVFHAETAKSHLKSLLSVMDDPLTEMSKVSKEKLTPEVKEQFLDLNKALLDIGMDPIFLKNCQSGGVKSLQKRLDNFASEWKELASVVKLCMSWNHYLRPTAQGLADMEVFKDSVAEVNHDIE